MGLEDWGYRWLKRYMDAPQWIKAPLGRAYSLLPDRLRHGRDFPRYRAEAALATAADVERLAEHRLRETLTWAAHTVPAYAALATPLLVDMPVGELLALFPLMTKRDYKRNPDAYLSPACTTPPCNVRQYQPARMVFWTRADMSGTPKRRFSFQQGWRPWVTSSTALPARQWSPMQTPASSSPATARFSPNAPGACSTGASPSSARHAA